MPKRITKLAKMPTRNAKRNTSKTPKQKSDKWEQDPPAMVEIMELAKLADVSDDTIRNMVKEPNSPRVIGKKFPREPWLHYIQIRQLYGPQALKLMTPEEVRRAAAESAEPFPAGGSPGAPTPAPIGGDESGNVISAPELLRLNQGDLLKRKTAEELITRRLANQERKRRLIQRAEVEEWFWSRMQSVLSYKREIALELPPRLVGLERPEIESRISASLDELFRRINLFLQSIQPAAAPVDSGPAPDEKAKPRGN
jgi:hypothetical protein